MAARSSYNEERNLLRIREWERRNQEALQEKEFYQENVPLFGEPYKTNKGDELSSRIQRMLGSYENVNNPNPHPCFDSSFSNDPPSHVTTTYRRPSHSRDRVKPPFQNTPLYGAGQSGSGGPPISSHSSQPLKKLPGPSSSYTQSSLGFSQGQASPDPLKRKCEPSPWPDLRECASLPPVLSALSPPAEPLSPLHSSDPSDSEPQDTPDRHQGSPLHPKRHPASLLHPNSPIPMEGSPLDDPQRDIPPLTIEGATTLPSQTFPLPLASKPNLVMPQKPTAYVRPMDGQDQVTIESPDLKPSPEDFHGQSYHEPLPDLKSTKPSLSKLKIPSQSIETLSNEAHCVEDILREMTHSWPPLLTAIHTPSTSEPSKFSFPVKEAQHVPPAFPGQKHYGSPPPAPSSTIICQQSSSTVVATHSSGVESASSSDSESSSGSESDSESSESGTEEAPQPLRSSSPSVPKAEGPVVTNWQLNNWIRVSQQNPSTESQSDAVQSPLPKQQQSHDAEEEEAIPPRDNKSHTPPQCPEFSDSEAKPPGSDCVTCNQHVRHKSPAASHVGDSSSSQRKTVGNKHPSRPVKAPRPEDSQAGLRVESMEVAPRDQDPSFTVRPKVKTKTGHSSKSGSAKTDSKKPAKRNSSEKGKTKQPESGGSGPKVNLVLDCKRERSPSPSPTRVVETNVSVRKEILPAPQKGQKKPRSRSPAAAHQAKRESSAKASRDPQGPPRALLVKIELNLLSRVPPQGSRISQGGQDPSSRKRPNTAPEKGVTDPASPIPTKVCKKRTAEKDVKALPRKKPKLEKDGKPSSSCPGSCKSATPKNPGEEKERKRSKKGAPVPLQDPGKEPGGRKRHAVEAPEPSAASAAKSRDREASTPVKHKKNTGKRHTEHSKTGKAPKSSFAFSVPAQPTGAALSSRPLLKFKDRQHPVEYHMKEAKKLKHKADATSDKVCKAFNYLDAAMSFVESGIAMETDPQTPKSAYTMFAETLDLIRFILKLKGSVDPSAPVTDKDFTILCMRCQSLLQMAMFRYKREAALKYSRTLTDHFKSSSKSAALAPSPCVSNTGTPSPMSPMPSPASTASSGPGSNHSSVVGMGNVTTVAIPQVIQQVASSYVNITALFLSAHDIWEQADELAHRGSGLLSELDSALGQLSLTSTMSSLVRHTRQGLQWLRLDTHETQ
ncbi:AF4/FMR2 family member 1 isoform X2 [Coregonus clupeaformis]|uniref:AF4/FMR2 family member 1 isoform X2 n=1 Tax=Coregonus clupeaformis TaxID=59861 RepID=UPI001E1C506A|nr:AF4/FMR2 family member 1 isoform X2 [Coregonus clupeaformis]